MTTQLRIWNQRAGRAMQWLLPPVCMSCQKALPPVISENPQDIKSLCEECYGLLKPLRLSRACHYCGATPFRDPKNPTPGRCVECEQLPKAFDQALGLFPYQGPVGMMIRVMKYRRAPYVAEALTELAFALEEERIRSFAADRLIVPAPMELFRQLRRGYNQAREIASAFAKRLSLPLVDETAVIRHRGGSPQARHHNRIARFENLSGLYAVKKKEAVLGRDLLVIDDVMTTGATAANLAMVLKEAGAKNIHVLTLVRARLGEDQEEETAK